MFVWEQADESVSVGPQFFSSIPLYILFLLSIKLLAVFDPSYPLDWALVLVFILIWGFENGDGFFLFYLGEEPKLCGISFCRIAPFQVLCGPPVRRVFGAFALFWLKGSGDFSAWQYNRLDRTFNWVSSFVAERLTTWSKDIVCRFVILKLQAEISNDIVGLLDLFTKLLHLQIHLGFFFREILDLGKVFRPWRPLLKKMLQLLVFSV